MEQNGRYARILPLMWSVGLLIERRAIMAPGGCTGGPLVDVDVVYCCSVGELGGPRRGGDWGLPLLYSISPGQRIVGHEIAVIRIAVWVPATQSTEKKMTNCRASLLYKALQPTDNPPRGLSVAEFGRQAP